MHDDDHTNHRRNLRIIVYLMLVLSAGASFLLGGVLLNAAREGDIPSWSPMVPGIMFTLFVIVYAADRGLLVKRHHYPMGRAIFQVAFALVFLTLLWRQPNGRADGLPYESDGRDYAVQLLGHNDSRVRAAACELLGLRGDPSTLSQIENATNDPNEIVRSSCNTAITILRKTPRP